MWEQVIQVGSSFLILTAFIAAQAGRMSPSSITYLVLNVVGSAILAVLAAMHHDYGFLLLEGVWACVSGWGLVAVLRGKTPAETAIH